MLFPQGITANVPPPVSQLLAPERHEFDLIGHRVLKNESKSIFGNRNVGHYAFPLVVEASDKLWRRFLVTMYILFNGFLIKVGPAREASLKFPLFQPPRFKNSAFQDEIPIFAQRRLVKERHITIATQRIIGIIQAEAVIAVPALYACGTRGDLQNAPTSPPTAWKCFEQVLYDCGEIEFVLSLSGEKK